jgi:hypothetical protein
METHPLPLAVYHVRRELEYGLTFYRNHLTFNYDWGSVPQEEHLLVAPENSQAEIAKLRAAAASLTSGTMRRSMWITTGLRRGSSQPLEACRLFDAAIGALLPQRVPPVCLSSSNALNSEFCRREPSRRVLFRLTVQEPRGDSRPQAFFVRGFASAARR